jgi:hypothetical protein
MNIRRILPHTLPALLLTQTLALTACAIDLEEVDGLDNADEGVIDDDSLSQTEQAVLSGWTPLTSEEFAPVSCGGSSFVAGFKTTGSYGDTLSVWCEPTTETKGDSYWTPYISDEYRGMMYCEREYWVTGLACRGKYCDDVSIQCTRIAGSYPYEVTASWWISEENPPLVWTYLNKFAKGVQCSGAYCDNVRFARAFVRKVDNSSLDTVTSF